MTEWLGQGKGGAYAWQAADKLAEHPRFQEMRIERNLPRGADMAAGAIVVWDQNLKGGLKAGHISVALGDGREASDRFRPQFENLPAGCRVFLPRG